MSVTDSQATELARSAFKAGRSEALAECAALCREAGCICSYLAETNLQKFKALGGEAFYRCDTDTVRRVWAVTQHARVCPDALASRIEARGGHHPKSP